MWILIAKIYWADLLHVRKPGRRLVVALEAHLQLVKLFGSDVIICRYYL